MPTCTEYVRSAVLCKNVVHSGKEAALLSVPSLLLFSSLLLTPNATCHLTVLVVVTIFTPITVAVSVAVHVAFPVCVSLPVPVLLPVPLLLWLLQGVLEAFVQSCKSLGPLCMLLGLFVFVSALIGTQILAASYPTTMRPNFFHILPNKFGYGGAVTVFQILTGEAWSDIAYQASF